MEARPRSGATPGSWKPKPICTTIRRDGYDPTLARWIQPDTLIPLGQGVQAFDRYAYAKNNPVRYKDPTGHWIESVFDIASIAYDVYDISKNGLNWGTGLALAADVGSLILPGVAGGGVAVRALTHADEVVDVAKAVDVTGDVIQTANQAENAIQAANKWNIRFLLIFGEN